jgi:adenosylhomocysteine nucleosidase
MSLIFKTLKRNSFVFFFFIHSVATAQVYQPRPVVGILGAFGEEVKLLVEAMDKPKTKKIHGMTFVTGTLRGQKVVVAETGIGKVNASMTTTLLLSHFRPKQVLFTGIAGGLNPALNPGDIVIGKEVGHHDYNWTTFNKVQARQTLDPIGQRMNPAFFPADSLLMTLVQKASAKLSLEAIEGRTPSVVMGRIVTGDVFVSSEKLVETLRADFQADATEMEGAAVAQVCFQQRVPHLVIRSLSDKADAKARETMLSFLKTAARNSARLTMQVLEEMPR